MSGTTRIKRPVRAIERRRGDTWPIRVEVTDEDGLPVNITGHTVKFVVDKARYPAPGSTSFEFELTGAIIDGLGGVVEFTPTAPSAAIAAGPYFYEVKLTGAGGAKVTVANESYTVL